MFTGVAYATAAARPMKMIYVSRAHQATENVETDLASSPYHDYVSLHFTGSRRELPAADRESAAGSYRLHEISDHLLV